MFSSFYADFGLKLLISRKEKKKDTPFDRKNAKIVANSLKIATVSYRNVT